MTTFYLCRHGQTENNKNNRLSGWIDTPLTAEGVANTASSAAKLHGVLLDKIISSDLGRAFITAYLVGRQLGYTAEIERTPGLREVNYGDAANMLVTEAIAAYPLLDDGAPHGESLAQMQSRVLACVDGIARDNPGKTILLVAHDGAINAIQAAYAKLDIKTVNDASANPHDFVAKIGYDDGQVVSFEPIAQQ